MTGADEDWEVLITTAGDLHTEHHAMQSNEAQCRAVAKSIMGARVSVADKVKVVVGARARRMGAQICAVATSAGRAALQAEKERDGE